MIDGRLPGAARLTDRERAAVAGFLDRVLPDPRVPVRRLVLFGSKARGDFDDHSDLDLLLLCDAPGDERIDEVGRTAGDAAEAIEHEFDVPVEPWAVALEDLAHGRRTPMLVDALADGITLWPGVAPPLRVPFTPEDARFCAGRLLEWVAEGGPATRAALEEGRLVDAAGRTRDDITRLATAAMLLTGETRHRRAGSLVAFRRTFVWTGEIAATVLPALDWAHSAFPADGGRGCERPAVPPAAAASAAYGRQAAARMERDVVPWVLARMRQLEGVREFGASMRDRRIGGIGADRSVSSRAAIPPSIPLPRAGGLRPRSGTSPYAVP